MLFSPIRYDSHPRFAPSIRISSAGRRPLGAGRRPVRRLRAAWERWIGRGGPRRAAGRAIGLSRVRVGGLPIMNTAPAYGSVCWVGPAHGHKCGWAPGPCRKSPPLRYSPSDGNAGGSPGRCNRPRKADPKAFEDPRRAASARVFFVGADQNGSWPPAPAGGLSLSFHEIKLLTWIPSAR